MQEKINIHKPVLIDEIVSLIELPNCNIFDGTLGGGGYTRAFLDTQANVFACDLDNNAIINFFYSRPVSQNIKIENNNFSNYISIFEDYYFDMIVLDLGYSSNQLESGSRGFSYQKVSEIFDLRYNVDIGQPVYEKIRKLKSYQELGKVIYTFSGETFSMKIASVLFQFIKGSKSEIYVKDVVGCVDKSIPKQFIHKKNSILSRVWQALRVWVNDEFTNLSFFLETSVLKLKTNGLLVIVSFNSLEDKIVTKFMRNISKKKVIDEFGNTTQSYELISKHAVKPSKEEVDINIRSRSAVMRVLKRL